MTRRICRIIDHLLLVGWENTALFELPSSAHPRVFIDSVQTADRYLVENNNMDKKPRVKKIYPFNDI